MLLNLQTKILIAILILTIGFASGFKVAGWFYKSDEADDIKAQLKTSDTIADDTKKEVKQAQSDKQDTKIIYRNIYKRIQDENDNRICFADSTALGLWNEAIAGKNSDRPIATGKASEPYAIVATVEQVLTNASENFETCNTNSINHNALIDRIEALDGKMCVCNE